MELEFNNEINESKSILEKFTNIKVKIDDDINNNKNDDINNNIKINRTDSFNCDMSKHIFNPDKSSPDKKFFLKGLLRLEQY
tara:strand:- start:964 stop:1209 length:246 start_codon:yes stop_codon:yes gene_type:complete